MNKHSYPNIAIGLSLLDFHRLSASIIVSSFPWLEKRAYAESHKPHILYLGTKVANAMSHSDSVKITYWNSGLQLLCHSRGLVVVLVLVGIRGVQLKL